MWASLSNVLNDLKLYFQHADTFMQNFSFSFKRNVPGQYVFTFQNVIFDLMKRYMLIWISFIKRLTKFKAEQ